MSTTTRTIRRRQRGSDASPKKATSRKASSMNGASSTSSASTRSKRTSSRVSEDGPSRCDTPAYPQTRTSGPGRAPVSRSRRQDAAEEQRTPATSGPSGDASLTSADLSFCLANRLRARLEGRGSPLYKLTWKHWDIPSGLRICALRGSVLRTSDNACSSWPSPTVNDAKGSAYSYGNGRHDRPCLKLVGAARLAGWATAAAEAGGTPEQFLARKQKAIDAGKQLGLSLTSLNLQAQSTAPGPTSSGGRAAMGSSGQLNPELSRWLMGYRAAWSSCAATETPSSRSSQRSSSSRRSK